MPLWGNRPSQNAKPKYLTPDQQENCFATNDGWRYTHTDGTQEILVAIGDLALKLGQAQITSAFFTNSANTYVRGATASVTVDYNENVKVTGSPTLVVTGSAANNATATYASGSGTNQLVFSFTVPSVAQTLSLSSQSITLAGGNIVDSANNTVVADLSFTASQVTGLRGKAAANTTVAVA